MCVEHVSQCDWCLFRRHVCWDQCKSFRKLLYQSVKHQDFLLPEPKDCENTVPLPNPKESEETVTGFVSAKVIVKISLGACPSPACLSELWAAIKRKKEARREAYIRRALQLREEIHRIDTMIWVWVNCSRVPIRRPSTTSLLTLAFQEQEEEEEWEDASESDDDDDDADMDLEHSHGQEQGVVDSLDGLGQSGRD